MDQPTPRNAAIIKIFLYCNTSGYYIENLMPTHYFTIWNVIVLLPFMYDFL